jgi:hypothetical protein
METALARRRGSGAWDPAEKSSRSMGGVYGESNINNSGHDGRAPTPGQEL